MKITHRITQTGWQWVLGWKRGKVGGQAEVEASSQKEDKASRATKLCKKSGNKTAEQPGQSKSGWCPGKRGGKAGGKAGCPRPKPHKLSKRRQCESEREREVGSTWPLEATRRQSWRRPRQGKPKTANEHATTKQVEAQDAYTARNGGCNPFCDCRHFRRIPEAFRLEKVTSPRQEINFNCFE